MDTTNSPSHDYPSTPTLHLQQPQQVHKSFDPWRNSTGHLQTQSQTQFQSQVPSTATSPPIVPPKPSLTNRNSSFNNNSNFQGNNQRSTSTAAPAATPTGPYHRPILTMPPVILMGGPQSVPPSPIVELPPSPAPNSMPIVEYPTDDEHEMYRNSGQNDRYFVEVRINIFVIYKNNIFYYKKNNIFLLFLCFIAFCVPKKCCVVSFIYIILYIFYFTYHHKIFKFCTLLKTL